MHIADRIVDNRSSPENTNYAFSLTVSLTRIDANGAAANRIYS